MHDRMVLVRISARRAAGRLLSMGISFWSGLVYMEPEGVWSQCHHASGLALHMYSAGEAYGVFEEEVIADASSSHLLWISGFV